MARQRTDALPSPARRTLRVMRDFLLIFGVAFLLPWLGYRVFHQPRGTDPAVAMPAHVTGGSAPGTYDSGDYRLAVSGVRWIRQSELPAGLKLTFRARPSPVVDYLVVSVAVTDKSGGGLPLTFDGSGQDVRLLLASTDPAAFHTDPISPSEAEAIAGEPPLTSGALGPGDRRSGVLVYAVEPYRKGLELVLVPVYPIGTTPADGPQQPAFEIRLPPAR